MAKVYQWSARRAGGRITITHSSGKISGIDSISPINGRIVAVRHNGTRYELVVS